MGEWAKALAGEGEATDPDGGVRHPYWRYKYGKLLLEHGNVVAAQGLTDDGRFAVCFGGKGGGASVPGSFKRPAMDLPEPKGAAGLKKGQRVRHGKYGEGTVLMREGEGEDAKLTVMFTRHGMKKLMEKFANLEKI